MASVDFEFKKTIIPSHWLNDVDAFVFESGFKDLLSSQFLRSDMSDTFSGSQLELLNSFPELALVDSDAGADEKRIHLVGASGGFSMRAVNDLQTASSTFFNLARTGITVDSIDLTATNINAVGNVNVSNSFQLVNATPRIYFNESDAGVDQKFVRFISDNEVFKGQILSDNLVNAKDWLVVQRSGLTTAITVDSIDLTAVAINLNGNIDITAGSIFLDDLESTYYGSGNDIAQYWDGINLYLDFKIANTQFYIRNVANANQFRFDITTGDFLPAGTIRLQDNKSLNFGTGNDIVETWNGSNFLIDFQTVDSNLYIRNVANTNQFIFNLATGNLGVAGQLSSTAPTVTSGITKVFVETANDSIIKEITPANLITDLGLPTLSATTNTWTGTQIFQDTSFSNYPVILARRYSTSGVVNGTTPQISTTLRSVFYWALSGNSTPTIQSPSYSSYEYVFRIRITNAGGYSITWPASVVWPGGVVATIGGLGTWVSWLEFRTINAGTTWYARGIGSDYK